MPSDDGQASVPLGTVIRNFYEARRTASRTGDLSLLEPFIAAGVRWCEPDVGAHMGVLEGRDTVLDMIRRALRRIPAHVRRLNTTSTSTSRTRRCNRLDASSPANTGGEKNLDSSPRR